MARRGVYSGKAGPKLALMPLEKQLESAVAYEIEARLQRICVPSHTLPSEYVLDEVHAELERVVTQ